MSSDSPPLNTQERYEANDSMDQISQSGSKLASDEDYVETNVSPISESFQQPIVPARPKTKAQQISSTSDMIENSNLENLTNSIPFIPTRPLNRNTTSTLEKIISGYSNEIDSDIETNTRETINDTALGTINDVEHLSSSGISTSNDSNNLTRLSEDNENGLDSNGAKPIVPCRPQCGNNITDAKTLMEEARGILEDEGPIPSEMVEGDLTNERDPAKSHSVDESKHQKNIEDSNKVDIPNMDKRIILEHSETVKPKANSKEEENPDGNSKVTENSSDLNIDKSESIKQKQESEPQVDFKLQGENDILPVCDHQGEILTPIIPERPTKATIDNTKRPHIPDRPRKKILSEATEVEVTNTKPKAPPPKPKKTSAKIAAFQQMFNVSESTLPQRRDSIESTSSKTTSKKLSTEKIKFAENLRNVVGRGFALPGMADASLSKSSNDTSEQNQLLEPPESKITNEFRKARKPKGRLPKTLKEPMIIKNISRFKVVSGRLWKYTNTKNIPYEVKDENVELDPTRNSPKLMGENDDSLDKQSEFLYDISTEIAPREESTVYDESKVIHDEQNPEAQDEDSSKEIADVADEEPHPEVCYTDSEVIVIDDSKNGCSSDPNETSHGTVIEHSEEQDTNSDQAASLVENENDSSDHVQEKVDSIKPIGELVRISEHRGFANDENGEPQAELPLLGTSYESNEQNEQTLDEVPIPLIDDQE